MAGRVPRQQAHAEEDGLVGGLIGVSGPDSHLRPFARPVLGLGRVGRAHRRSPEGWRNDPAEDMALVLLTIASWTSPRMPRAASALLAAA
jgi:hypothetical protein